MPIIELQCPKILDKNLLRGTAPDLTAGRPPAAAAPTPAPFPLFDDKLTCVFFWISLTDTILLVVRKIADEQLLVAISNADSASTTHHHMATFPELETVLVSLPICWVFVLFSTPGGIGGIAALVLVESSIFPPT